ncbi:hypothetical protein [Chitinophaga barathri]|uniref:Uncharacterized protein n=1 Tax=Chitinophaga barathri TaxID=1647451 RepID=A0A3N4M898_9BACT|nr:hypothetical protein [Chitinophaga barathri]RPD39588.1 hypothetical protein EG028_18225 [Chitinophaga barathri]
MKILLFSLLGIALLTLSAAYYLEHEKPPVERPQPITAAQDACPDPCTGEMKWVTMNEAVEMIAEYGKNQYKGIKKGITDKLRPTRGDQADQFADARYITFPVDTIKKFICQVESILGKGEHLNAADRRIKPCDLGIKFYYAAYRGIAAEADIKRSKKGRHTLLMIPTYWDDSLKEYIEFFPGYVLPDKHTMPLGQVFDDYYVSDSKLAYKKKPLPSGNPPMMLLSLSIDRDAGKNQGNLCPPPDGCRSALLQKARVLE